MAKNSTKYIFYLALFTSIISFLINLVTNFFIELLEPAFYLKILIFLASSIFLGILIAFGIFILNPIFSETIHTLRRILKFESLGNPLLMKLSSKAPGTYHHSLNVSTIAQKAAKSIGADSLLVRTAAYYHDIGKMEDPLIFSENQKEDTNVKDDALSIKNNAEKIISHVENGIEIAKRNKLPSELIDMIREHHGTTSALFFLHKAKEKGYKIKKTDFRYKGPIPQSRESAILMLADCIEAITRSAQNLSPRTIKEIVQNTILEKNGENQFRNSKLSESEFKKIAESFEQTLQSIYHKRIEYNQPKAKGNA